MGADDNPIPGILFGPEVAYQSTEGSRQKVSEAQQRAQQTDSALGDLGAGTDPDYVHTIEHFEGMTHEAMYQAVHGPGGMDAAGLQNLRRAWHETYADLVNLSTFNLMGMNRIFGDGLWQGQSGAGAQAASERFARAANQIGQVFGSVSNRLDALSWAAEALRTAVLPPMDAVTAPDPATALLPGLLDPAAEEQSRQAREQARQAVIRALNSIYLPTFPPAGTGVPAYAQVPQLPGGDVPGTGGPGGTGPAGTTGGPTDTGGGDQPKDNNPQPQAQNPGTPNTTKTEAAGTDTAKSTQNGQQTTTSPNKTDTSSPNSTTPAGVRGNPSTTPGNRNSRPGGPNGGRPGAPGSPSRPGGPGSSVPGAPSRSGPGTVGAPVSASRGTPGGTGPYGPMAPGAGARKNEDDNEHRSPDYLRGVQPDWTDGVVLPGGVIGSNPDLAPAAAAPPPVTAAADPGTAEPGAQSSINLSGEHPMTEEQKAELQRPDTTSTTITISGSGPMGGPAPGTGR